MKSEMAAATDRGVATRARIIDAAAELVRTRGLAKTSLDDIREASRASKSQLYHYFIDRDDLVLAVVERQIQRVLDSNEPLLRDMTSLADLQTWRNAMVEQADQADCAGGCPLGSLVGELGETPRARAAIAGGFTRWRSHFAKGFSRMKARGELGASTRPGDLATAMLAALQGGLLLAQVQRSTRPLALALDMALQSVEGAMIETSKG